MTRFDEVGNLFIVDMSSHVIRKVDMRTRLISTVAGMGSPGYSGDGGPAVKAQLNQPHSLQFDSDGNLFVCDIGNHVIRKIDTTSGIITTFAGTGKPGKTIDGAAITGTPLNGPRSIDFDHAGNLWLATREGNQVFRLNRATSTIEHVAGTGQKGFQDRDVPAKNARFSGPKGIAIDTAGNVWLADTENHCISMIDAGTGMLRLIAGTGRPGDGPVGEASECRLNRPHGVFVDRDGSVLIGDSESHRLRVIRRDVPLGTTTTSPELDAINQSRFDDVAVTSPASFSKITSHGTWN